MGENSWDFLVELANQGKIGDPLLDALSEHLDEVDPEHREWTRRIRQAAGFPDEQH